MSQEFPTSKEIKQLLVKGLQEGFAGGAVREGVQRGGFSMESSHYEGNEGRYHDEWVGNTLGGGQELVEVNGKIYTRLYAGGTIPPQELETLGITKKDVIGELKAQILKNGDKVRLQNFKPEANGPWQYQCDVALVDESLPVDIIKESITYQGRIVFTHYFLLCPVE